MDLKINWKIEAINLAKAIGEFYRQFEAEESITGEMPAYIPPPNNTIIGLFPNDPTLLIAVGPVEVSRLFLRWGHQVRGVESPHWHVFKSRKGITFEELYYALKRMLEHQTPFVHFLDPESHPDAQVREFHTHFLVDSLMSLSDDELAALVRDMFGDDIPDDFKKYM